MKNFDNWLIEAFVQGAKWREYKETGFTMWPSDVKEAYKEAKKQTNKTLGEDIIKFLERNRK